MIKDLYVDPGPWVPRTRFEHMYLNIHLIRRRGEGVCSVSKDPRKLGVKDEAMDETSRHLVTCKACLGRAARDDAKI